MDVGRHFNTEELNISAKSSLPNFIVTSADMQNDQRERNYFHIPRMLHYVSERKIMTFHRTFTHRSQSS